MVSGAVAIRARTILVSVKGCVALIIHYGRLNWRCGLNNKKQKELGLTLGVSSFAARFGADFALGIGLHNARSI